MAPRRLIEGLLKRQFRVQLANRDIKCVQEEIYKNHLLLKPISLSQFKERKGSNLIFSEVWILKMTFLILLFMRVNKTLR